MNLSVMELLDDLDSSKPELEMLNSDGWSSLVQELREHFHEIPLTPDRERNLVKLIDLFPEDFVVTLWGTLIQRTSDEKLIRRLIGVRLDAAFAEARRTSTYEDPEKLKNG
jgi:hypothetical protein